MGFLFYFTIFLFANIFLDIVFRFLRARIHFINSLYQILVKIGIIIHEFSHYFMNKICLVPVSLNGISFDLKNLSGCLILNYTQSDYKRVTFLKVFLGAMAPMICGTWILLFLWNSNIFLESILEQTLIIFFASSIILCMAPSKQDLKNIIDLIKWRPGVFVKQICLISIALCIYIIHFEKFIGIINTIPFIHEFIIIIGLEIIMEVLILFIYESYLLCSHRPSAYISNFYQKSPQFILPLYDPMEIIE